MRKWFNNGIYNRQFDPSGDIPEGFAPGMLSRSQLESQVEQHLNEIIEFVKSNAPISMSAIHERYPFILICNVDKFVDKYQLSQYIGYEISEDTKQRIRATLQTKRWFTNGVDDLLIDPNVEPVPEGFALGRSKGSLLGYKVPEELLATIAEKRRRTYIEHFGEDFREQFTAESKATKKLRYGDEAYCNAEKIAQTKLEKYGDKYYNNHEKAQETNLERYGGTGNASPTSRKKQEQTMLERYGVKHNWASDNELLNGKKTTYEKYGSKENFYSFVKTQGRATRLEKYGDEYYSNHEKASRTMLEKYGVECYLQLPEIHALAHSEAANAKRYQTMRENGSWSKSVPEETYYQSLVEKYGEEDIERQYSSDECYPFSCDFYVKSQDLFIECNFHWTHGYHPYDETNEEDIAIKNKFLESFERSGSAYYKTAVEVWTERDPKKLRTARENNLNFTRVYSDKSGHQYELNLFE